MKKIIVAALSVILGAFGYTVVDQAIETRVANLEAQVSIQQSVIDDMKFESGLRFGHDMDVGEEMICVPSEPTVYTLDNGTKVTIDSFTSTVYQHRVTGELCDDAGLTEFAETLFKYEISGKTDPRYAYRTIGFTIDTTYKQFSFWAQINSDGSFRTEYIRPFIKEFASEIRHIYIHDYDHEVTTAFPFTTKATTTTLLAEENTGIPTTTKKPYPTTTSVSYDDIIDSGYCGENAQWELTADGTLTIKGKGDMYHTIPDWNYCNKSVQRVIVRAGITSIGSYAFDGCANLTSISIPGSVTTIGGSVFRDCTSLTYIALPYSVTAIGNFAFQGCTSLTRIDIPAGVTSLGGFVFSNCTSLKSIELPKSVTSISDGAFNGCTSLERIEVYSGVTYIGTVAFQGCTSLEKIYIPDGVNIGYAAFNNCSSLKAVTIGKEVNQIPDMAFAGCVNLTDVYYAGTETEWNKIIVGTDNECLTDAKIHYNYTA